VTLTRKATLSQVKKLRFYFSLCPNRPCTKNKKHVSVLPQQRFLFSLKRTEPLCLLGLIVTVGKTVGTWSWPITFI